jgi:uroporphyrinogen decarboxylase
MENRAGLPISSINTGGEVFKGYGPFSLATMLMGITMGMMYMVDHPNEMKEILDFCSDVTIDYGTEMARSGCHALQFAEATASLIGRRAYAELVWPYDRKVIRALKQQDVYVFLHVCGNSTSTFDLMIDTGADCLEFDSQVDIA